MKFSDKEIREVQSGLKAERSGPLSGRIEPPGDKSISHRAFILGLLTIGTTEITGLLEAEDVLHTSRAVAALGAKLTRLEKGHWLVAGAGLGSLLSPDHTLDFGNAGTGSRLMMGVVAGHGITACFDGDASLRKRPMRRILDPLCLMGAKIVTESTGGRCPIVLQGRPDPLAIEYSTPVPSAQIKSAVLLAGLNALGATTIIEHEASRDHTEKMLRHFGARVTSENFGQFGRKITLHGRPSLEPNPIVVPTDPSSAAFPMVAALIVAGSDIIISGMMMNPLRIGLYYTLLEMGADIEILDQRLKGGEEVADLRVRASTLAGVDVPAERAPSMIDEYPILAIAASFAKGQTRMRGLQELRVKESDRLAAIVTGLRSAGVDCAIDGDDLLIEGNDEIAGGGMVETFLDHRIAMSFLIMGLASKQAMIIDDAKTIATSFPEFREKMSALGARFEAP